MFNVIDELKKRGGYYECVKDADGKRLTPLVGYAGKGRDGKQKVGDVYCNCAVLEENDPQFFLRHLAYCLPGMGLGYSSMLNQEQHQFISGNVDVICAMPLGGLAFGLMIASAYAKKYVPPEKKMIQLASEAAEEKSELVWGRYKPKSGERILIVEDAINNISTGAKAAKLIREAGAIPVGLLGLLNRSYPLKTTFEYEHDGEKFFVPVMAIQENSFPQYEQTDPEVAEDLAKGNLVPKPKQEWKRLMDAVAQAGQK